MHINRKQSRLEIKMPFDDRLNTNQKNPGPSRTKADGYQAYVEDTDEKDEPTPATSKRTNKRSDVVDFAGRRKSTPTAKVSSKTPTRNSETPRESSNKQPPPQSQDPNQYGHSRSTSAPEPQTQKEHVQANNPGIDIGAYIKEKREGKKAAEPRRWSHPATHPAGARRESPTFTRKPSFAVGSQSSPIEASSEENGPPRNYRRTPPVSRHQKSRSDGKTSSMPPFAFAEVPPPGSFGSQIPPPMHAFPSSGPAAAIPDPTIPGSSVLAGMSQEDIDNARPGYWEAKMAEEAKLEAVRRKVWEL
jgi:hypothetical protein